MHVDQGSRIVDQGSRIKWFPWLNVWFPFSFEIYFAGLGIIKRDTHGVNTYPFDLVFFVSGYATSGWAAAVCVLGAFGSCEDCEFSQRLACAVQEDDPSGLLDLVFIAILFSHFSVCGCLRSWAGGWCTFLQMQITTSLAASDFIFSNR